MRFRSHYDYAPKLSSLIYIAIDCSTILHLAEKSVRNSYIVNAPVKRTRALEALQRCRDVFSIVLRLQLG
jgi:hypothetical protein